jgi:hypothetical protein
MAFLLVRYQNSSKPFISHAVERLGRLKTVAELNKIFRKLGRLREISIEFLG